MEVGIKSLKKINIEKRKKLNEDAKGKEIAEANCDNDV